MKKKGSYLQLIYVICFFSFWIYNVLRARAYVMACFGVFVFLLIMYKHGLFDLILRKGPAKEPLPREKEQTEMPPPQPQEDKPVEWKMGKTEPLKKEDDWAAEFERKLKKTTEREAAMKKTAQQEKNAGRVNPKRSDAQRVLNDDKVVHDNEERIRYDGPTHVDNEKTHDNKGAIHHDNEPLHDTKGRVHYDKEALQHDKSKIYYDPRGDYSYDEERMNAEAAAFSAQHRARRGEQQQRKVKLKHAALVNGFIMSEVLGKPRGLQ